MSEFTVVENVVAEAITNEGTVALTASQGLKERAQKNLEISEAEQAEQQEKADKKRARDIKERAEKILARSEKKLLKVTRDLEKIVTVASKSGEMSVREFLSYDSTDDDDGCNLAFDQIESSTVFTALKEKCDREGLSVKIHRMFYMTDKKGYWAGWGAYIVIGGWK